MDLKGIRLSEKSKKEMKFNSCYLNKSKCTNNNNNYLAKKYVIKKMHIKHNRMPAMQRGKGKEINILNTLINSLV